MVTFQFFLKIISGVKITPNFFSNYWARVDNGVLILHPRSRSLHPTIILKKPGLFNNLKSLRNSGYFVKDYV